MLLVAKMRIVIIKKYLEFERKAEISENVKVLHEDNAEDEGAMTKPPCFL